MKALVIDAAASCMHIAAKNDDFKASISLDLGQKQSQKLLPSIDYILEQVGLKSSELEYTALTSGPGTFTGPLGERGEGLFFTLHFLRF